MKIFGYALLFLFSIEAHAQFAESQEVVPQSLSGTPSFELGDVLLALMPPPSRTFLGWDWQANSPIQWQDGYTLNSGATRSYRNGVVRINVLGQISTVLRKHQDELGWTVSLYTDAPPKFGPDSISVSPGFEGSDGACFGTLFSGCDFDPMPSIKRAGITAKFVCTFDEMGNKKPSADNFTRTYAVTAPGKARAFIQYQVSSGSGGSSTTVVLLTRATAEQACKPD